MTVLGICRRPRASAGWVRGPSTKPSSTRSAYLVPSAEFATPGLGVLVIDDPECLKVKVKTWGTRDKGGQCPGSLSATLRAQEAKKRDRRVRGERMEDNLDP